MYHADKRMLCLMPFAKVDPKLLDSKEEYGDQRETCHVCTVVVGIHTDQRDLERLALHALDNRKIGETFASSLEASRWYGRRDTVDTLKLSLRSV